MRYPIAILIVFILYFSPSADVRSASGSSCAARLQPISKKIYSGALARRVTPDTMEQVITAEVMKLLSSKQLTISKARPAAEAAARCIELAQK